MSAAMTMLKKPLYGAFLLLLVVGLPSLVAADEQKPPAHAVASAHPLATQAGMAILEAGGNAFDAAITVSAVLAVVEPYSSGIGGGGFWLLHRARDGKQVMIDGRERAPMAAHRDMYLDKGGNVVPRLSMDGALAAGIPGEPAALAYLAEHYGRLPLRQTLASAIRIAGEGFEVDDHYRRMAEFRAKTLGSYAASKEIFLSDGEVPAIGQLIKQPDLAMTLQTLADKGHAGFYKGELARRLVDGVRNAGGIWTLEDLENYQVIEREPVRFRYRDMSIVAAAPPSSGGTALATMLHILEPYPLTGMKQADRVHLIVEAMRRAYRDRAQYLGDPDFVDIPLERLAHPLYADGLRASIREDRATPSTSLPGSVAAQGGNDTTHFSILDREGNRVSATLSINYPFGAALVVPGTGILLNDEMDDFSAKPGVPNAYGLVGAGANAIEAGKRPLSSMTPVFVESDRGVGILGTPGGSRIITMVLLGILDLEKQTDPASWVAVERFHHQYLPDVIQHEPDTFSETVILDLEARGHALKLLSSEYGNMQAIYWDYAAKSVRAASDPRGIGEAQAR